MMQTLPRRRLAGSLAVCAAVSLILTACGGDAGTSTSDGGGKEASAMYTWISNENDRAQWEAFIDAAKTSDPAFELTLDGPSFTDYWTKVKTRMASSGAPCIITTQAARTQELSGLLTPLDELAESNDLDIGQFNDAMIQGMTIDGELRAVPYDAEPYVLYYNKDLFQAAGLQNPSQSYTREQFLSDAKALTSGSTFGLAIQPQFVSGPGVNFAFADGHFPTKDGKLDITNSDFVQDMQFAFDLVNKQKVAKAPQSSDTGDVAQQQFLSGEAAMIFDGPWMYEQYTSSTNGSVGISVVPSTSGEAIGLIQGSGFGITTTCEDKEAAFQNILKITTPEVIGAVGASRGTVPSVESAVEDWAGSKPTEDVATIEALLETGQPLETTENWNQVETLFSQYSVEGFRGTETAESILSRVSDSAK